MNLTPSERRILLVASLLLGSGYVLAGLRAVGILPSRPSPGCTHRDVAAASPSASGGGNTVPTAGRISEPSFATGDTGSESHGLSAPEVAIAPESVFCASFLDLNRADSIALVALPGIGPKLAAKILDLRRRLGRFSSLEDLLAVRGIGPRRLEAIKGYVVVTDSTNPTKKTAM